MTVLLKFSFFVLFNRYLIALSVISTPGIALALEADGKAKKGVEFYQKHQFNQAAKSFLEASQGKPSDPKISYNLGNSLYKQSHYTKALQSYSKSLEQNLNSSINQKANYNMGNTLFRMNKLEESILAYKKALEIDPSDIDSKFNLEFVREQIKKEQQQNKKDKNGEKNKANDKKEGSNKEREKNSLTNKEPPNPQKTPNHNKPENNAPEKRETVSKKMTKEEAEQRLSVLTEDLKQFQRKQALEMKTLFTYQGNDW